MLKPSRYKGLYGGRGAGKSHFFAELGIERCLFQAGLRMVCVREVQRSLKESVKRLLEDKIERFDLHSKFRILKDSIVTPGEGSIVFQGMQDHTAESIKSLEGFDVAYVEEAQTLTKRSLELLRPTIRKPNSELWFSWNPRTVEDPVDELLRGSTPPEDAIVLPVSYRDNPWFPAELEQERLHDYLHNAQRYGHIWEGEYEPAALGALWNRHVIHRNRRSEAPEFKRILVGVDPPAASPRQDKQTDVAECGIIVGGLGIDDRGYVIGDYSRRGTPQEWAEAVIAAYDLHEADAIVVEVNQGGEMVKHTLRSVRQGIRVIEVRATRGKQLRAEPISALSELDRISHVGAFPELEAQMCLITPDGYQGHGSPDRLDAMVWVFTELFPKLTRRQTPQNRQLPARANSSYSVIRRTI